ncbi:unnamed protein product [Brassicogethes aeneus]|uniref:Uncharacterized protein n=1 Tax=Brassicogethes aeneus TaxID=1431903 RepID=A0A9P0FM16_BRAAE|nr:unnamed protein product [Brassicogethes aeneus]
MSEQGYVDKPINLKYTTMVLTLCGANGVGKSYFAHKIKSYLENYENIDVFIFKENEFNFVLHEVKELLRHLLVDGDRSRTTLIILDMSLTCRRERYEVTAISNFYYAHNTQVFFQPDLKRLFDRNMFNDKFNYDHFALNINESAIPTSLWSYEKIHVVPPNFDMHEECRLLDICLRNLKFVPLERITDLHISGYINRSNLMYSNFSEEVLFKMDAIFPKRYINNYALPVPDIRNYVYFVEKYYQTALGYGPPPKFNPIPQPFTHDFVCGTAPFLPQNQSNNLPEKYEQPGPNLPKNNNQDKLNGKPEPNSPLNNNQDPPEKFHYNNITFNSDIKYTFNIPLRLGTTFAHETICEMPKEPALAPQPKPASPQMASEHFPEFKNQGKNGGNAKPKPPKPGKRQIKNKNRRVIARMGLS